MSSHYNLAPRWVSDACFATFKKSPLKRSTLQDSPPGRTAPANVMIELRTIWHTVPPCIVLLPPLFARDLSTQPTFKSSRKRAIKPATKESQRCSSGGHRHTPDDCGFKQHGTRLPAQALFSFLSLLPLLRQVSLDTKQLKVRSLCYYKVLCLPINFYF